MNWNGNGWDPGPSMSWTKSTGYWFESILLQTIIKESFRKQFKSDCTISTRNINVRHPLSKTIIYVQWNFMKYTWIVNKNNNNKKIHGQKCISFTKQHHPLLTCISRRIDHTHTHRFLMQQKINFNLSWLGVC